MLSKTKLIRSSALLVMVLYGVELLDELNYGLYGATLPQLRDAFALTYTQIGLLFTLPSVISVLIEPVMGLLGDTRHRRTLVLIGIVATSIGLVLIAAAQTYGVLLLAFGTLYIASGAYVNLSQATLIDRAPTRAEQTMARWTLLGAIGVTAGPLLMTVLFSFGIAWRGAYVALAVIAALFAVALFQQGFDSHDGAHAEPQAVSVLARNLLNALRQRSLLKWVLLTELADFMLDKLLEVTGLYFHDVAGVSLAGASAAVAVSTVAGLIGSALLVPVLERQTGVRVLRASAIIVLLAYILFLTVPVIWLKYVLIGVISLATSIWFAILRAKTFEALPGQSGLVVAVTSLANISSLFVPLLLGGLADAIGLQSAMWLLALGPVALIIGLR